MKTKKLKFQDFEADKLSKKEQKTVRGGDVPTEPDPIDPGKGTGKGNQQSYIQTTTQFNIKNIVIMKSKNIKFEDFENEKLSKKQQKTIHGGDGEEPIDPGKGTGKGGNG